MIVGQEEKPPLEELAHYGVKGMQWGVSRGQREPRKSFRGFTLGAVKEGSPKAERIKRESAAHDKVTNAKTVAEYNRALDNLAAVQRQNRAEASKQKVESSKQKKMTRTPQQEQQRRRNRQQLAAVGALVAINLLAKYGSIQVSDIRSRPEEVTAIGSTAAKLKFVKPNRSGVHTITTMK